MNVSEIQVNYLTKLVALKPGKTVLEMIKNVMQGKDEGTDNPSTEKDGSPSGVVGRVSMVSWLLPYGTVSFVMCHVSWLTANFVKIVSGKLNWGKTASSSSWDVSRHCNEGMSD